MQDTETCMPPVSQVSICWPHTERSVCLVLDTGQNQLGSVMRQYAARQNGKRQVCFCPVLLKATGVSFTRWRRRANAVANELKEIQNKITFSPELSDCKFRTLVDNGQRCQLIHSSVADKAEKKKAFNLNFWASNIHRFVLGSHNFLYCFFIFFSPTVYLAITNHYLTDF